MMKRNILSSFIVFIIIAFMLTACEAIDDCKSCSKVTYNDDGEIGRTPGVQYCGDELAEKESTAPVTVLGVTTAWECN
jgi:hypothetical protein